MIIDRNWAKPSGGGGGDNTKLKEIVEGTITELTAEDLEGVTKITNYAFYQNKTSEFTIQLPSTVKEISSNAFGYSYLKNIDLGSVESIGGSAFQSCSKLELPTFPNTLTSIGSSCFSDCRFTGELVIPKNITDISSSTFSGCSYVTSAKILSDLTTIPSSMFRNCYALRTCGLPDSAIIIASYCFYGSGLSEISLPENLRIIQDFAFAYVNLLLSVTIPDSVEEIREYAFRGCQRLETITIGSGIQSIEEYALNSDSLINLTVKAQTPPTLASNAIPTTIQTIYIPAGTLEAYSTATNWSSFADKFVEIPAD